MSAPNDITFAISLDTPDRLDVRYITDTLRDVEQLLADIEKHLRGTAQARWTWQQEPTLELVACVNGISFDDLQRIVEDAENGFRSVMVARDEEISEHAAHWPASFGATAKNRVKSIVRRLEEVESITVRVANRAPLVIEAAQVVDRFIGKERRFRSMYSSVEGRLDLISHRGKLRAAVQEIHNPQNSVTCSFGEEMIERIKSLFDKRVVVEGLVRYRQNGTPVSISDIKRIDERKPGPSLASFIGAAPDFTGGVSEDEYISRLRDDG